MASITIKGPNRLHGEVWISGAKNAALPLLAASLLVNGKMNWEGVPDLQDVATMRTLLTQMGAYIVEKRSPQGLSLEIDASHITQYEAPYDQVKAMRASVLVLGPLLARFGKARVALPGGCAIGSRPVDQHLKGLEAMGAKIQLDHGYIVAQCDFLKGAPILFDVTTVGGTQNIMMAAVLARGKTVLENAAREPEIVELAAALNKMGARIQGAGRSIIEIEGVSNLYPTAYRVMPDRIEAGTYLAAAALCKGDVWIKGCLPQDLDAPLETLREMGATIELGQDSIHIQGPAALKPFEITTHPHPGFPTDLQAPFLTLACLAEGASVLNETLFENRFMHVPELTRMGSKIHIHGQTAIVHGVPKLSGAEVSATDLRAAAGLVLAGLAAHGKTTVHQIHYLDRGYERMEEKLRGLGAEIDRVEEDTHPG